MEEYRQFEYMLCAGPLHDKYLASLRIDKLNRLAALTVNHSCNTCADGPRTFLLFSRRNRVLRKALILEAHIGKHVRSC